MSCALSVFGIGPIGGPYHFAYAMLRPVIGAGEYPKPNLPKAALNNNGARERIGKTDIELCIWDHVDDDVESIQGLLEDLRCGRLSLPADCPIDAGALLQGVVFGPVSIKESSDRMACAGAGVLMVQGFAMNEGLTEVVRVLRALTLRDEVGAELALVLASIAEGTGLGSFMREAHRLGVVDHFSRIIPGDSQDPTLFNVRLVKPDVKGREPARHVRIFRNAAPPDQTFRIQVCMRHFNSVVAVELVEFAANVNELILDGKTHVTDVEITVFFGTSGALADWFEGAFNQGFSISLTAETGTDILPRPFRGAPSSNDLERRRRLAIDAFNGPSAGNRAGGLDVLRQRRTFYEALVGAERWKGECHWFAPDAESQIEVIRWIKQKFEASSVQKAFLIDPFLGSEALKRVVLRQGNENIDLTILVSPGKINPDADEFDTAAEDSKSYVDSLVSTAEEVRQQLCGRIRIVHLRRAGGRKQAFHDRYVGLIDRDGVPHVFLISNSLSKAAGDWPFAIAELDRLASWTVIRYVEGLIEGTDRDRSLVVEEIWSSEAPAQSASAGHPKGSSPLAPGPAADLRATSFAETGSRLANEVWRAFVESPVSTEEALRADAVVDAAQALARGWPDAIDIAASTQTIQSSVNDRSELIALIVDNLRNAGRVDLADALDERLVDKVLESYVHVDGSFSGKRMYLGSNDLLRRAGRTIARRHKPTDFVRNQLNPVIARAVMEVEAPRGDWRRTVGALEAGIALLIVGLEVARSSASAPIEYRQGLAIDHCHLLGRLLRSQPFHTILGRPSHALRERFGFDVALSLASEMEFQFGPKLNEPINRLRSDPFIAEALKERLSGGTGRDLSDATC